MSNNLEYIERINHIGHDPEVVVIWLHGLGADYNDFTPLVSELNLDKCVKFIFPNAPIRPITINGGYEMRGWYDIRSLTDTMDPDNVGIMQSVAQIESLCDSLVENGVPANKIILAGFSQGGVISYYAGLVSKYNFAGIIALSCYLPNLNLIPELSADKLKLPIMSCHGTRDLVVPYSLGIDAYEYLHKKSCNITWNKYTMEHNVCQDEIKDIMLFINKSI